VTMVDPATGFFETVEIGQKTAVATASWLEIHWLTRHPWPAETTVDKGREFAREVSETLQNECGIKWKIVTSRDPQSNSMIERCHKTLHTQHDSQCTNQGQTRPGFSSWFQRRSGGMSESCEFCSAHCCTCNARTVN